MKVKAVVSQKFTPFNIEIRFESRKDAAKLFAILNHSRILAGAEFLPEARAIRSLLLQCDPDIEDEAMAFHDNINQRLEEVYAE